MSIRAKMQYWLPVVALMMIASRGSTAELKIDPQRDTLNPVYDWKVMPYSWEEIRAGRLPVSPAHWRRDPDNPVVARGMNPRPVSWDGSTVRVFYGRRGRVGGICYFDVDPQRPEQLKAGPVGPIITTGPKGHGGSSWAFGVAESFDAGVTWKRYGDEPLLQRGPPGVPDDGSPECRHDRRVARRDPDRHVRQTPPRPRI